MQTRRERVRQAAIDEIKSIAWEIAREHGMEDVTVNGIARRMGMTAPAFYSYFKSRDELIRELVIEAYQSFRHTLIIARDSVPESDIAGRIYQVFIAYREWAVTNASMFGLFAGKPVVGFESPDPVVIEEADQVYGVFLMLYEEAWQKGIIKTPGEKVDLPDGYVSDLKKVCEQRSLSFSVELLNLFVKNALLVHGMISMELSGRFSDLATDRSAFYQFQILDILKDFGIDYTPDDDI